MPTSLTTITPFSKLMALFLFILFPIAGFYVGMKYEGSKTINSSNKYYVAKLRDCSLADFTCPSNYEHFIDAKGCGCKLKTDIQNDVTNQISDNDLKNWKTYTTKQFTFRYPPEYQVDKTNYDSYFISSPSNPSIPPIKINIMQQYVGDTFDQIVKRAQGSFLPDSNIAMTNTDYGILISGQAPGYVKSIPMTFAFIRYKNTAIDFEQDVTESQTTLLKTIISTIKFIDGESSSPTKPADSNEPCVRAGCSGQLCLSASKAKDTVTTCEYKDEYACYQQAICERQTNGQCGWTETSEFNECMKLKKAN